MKGGDTGGVEAVVKAIRTHISNVGVCEQGCGTLNSITCNNGKRLTKMLEKCQIMNEINS